MRSANRWFARIRNFMTGRRGDERLREEMEQHLAMQTEENIRAGMPPGRGPRQARLKLGGVETIREQFHAEEGLPFLETLLQDLRFAFRVLRKSPGFAVTVVITLALGIGANTAIFSIVYGVVFRPLPYPHPQRIVELTESSPRGSDEEDVTYQEMQFLQEHGSPFQFLTGYTVQGYNLSVGNKTERVKGQPVSTDYFHVLGINPLLGRDFLAEENTGDGAHVAILSYGTWQTQMGGDRETIGRTITLDGEPFTVIGVMPPGLEGSVDPILPGDTDVWTPLALVGQTAGSGQNIEVLGRLRPGLALAQAQAQMRSITTAFRKAFPQELDPTTTLKYSALSGDAFERCSDDFAGAVWRSWARFADCLCQCCQSPAWPRHRPQPRVCSSRGARGFAYAAGSASAHGKRSAFNYGRFAGAAAGAHWNAIAASAQPIRPPARE